MTGYHRLLGGLLIGAWGWWASSWAVDFATVSPIHWAELLPRFVVEGVPATIGAAMAGLMVIGSLRARHVAWLFAATAVHSVIVLAAIPNLATRHDETLRQSRALWDPPVWHPAHPETGEPKPPDERSSPIWNTPRGTP